MDLRTVEARGALLKDIDSNENRDRKQRSFKSSEVYSDNLHQYVYTYLRKQFNQKTVEEMPVVASVNLAKRIVKEEATIYKEAPTRFFTDLHDEQSQTIQRIYEAMNADYTLSKANEFFKLQNQSLLQLVPKGGKIIMRVLKQHNYDVIPLPEDPEQALGYIVSAFDHSGMVDDYTNVTPTGYEGIGSSHYSSAPDGVDQAIGDRDDYKASLKRYVVWTKEYYNGKELVPAMNFIMDGKGNMLSEDPSNPLGNMLPFVDISGFKDYSYFVAQSSLLSDFTVEFNGALSDLMQVARLQGWSQAYLKASSDMARPENISVGPTRIIHLPVEADGVEPEFGFASPNPDLQGSISTVEFLLKCFLTSRGLSPKTVSGSADADKFNSGLERLLAMIDRFDATKEDYNLFETAEHQIYSIIKTWHNTLRATDALNEEFKTTELPETSKLSISFGKPEMIQTKVEKIDSHIKKIEMGIGSRITALMDIEDMSREEAEEFVSLLDKDEFLSSEIEPKEQDEQQEQEIRV